MQHDELGTEVKDLHHQIDDAVTVLSEIHGERLKCKLGCASCCIDGISVFNVEADNIRDWVGEKLQGHKPSEEGKCAFLTDSGACRVYPVRPYVCRTQGLPLRWIDFESGTEKRDICPINEPGENLLSLSEKSCWEIGPTEMQLRSLEEETGLNSKKQKRVRLRDLFYELSHY